MESLKTDLEDQTVQKDTYKIAYMIHFLLGAGNLLPWNALITAIDYFGYLYPEKHVEKVFSVAYMSSSLLALVVMIKWSNLRRTVSFRGRMNIGFTMFLISLMVTPTLGGSRFYVIVASVVVCGLADGLIGGSLIGSAGKLPKEYMQAIFAGTASSACLHGPKWFRSEEFVVLLTFMLGFTNGYLTSVIMILAPKSVPPLEAEMAAIVMALFLGIGLVSGSVLGWFWII
ncbi:equilibrative nucleotide transporter 8-like protein [Tanacetum coccineum]